jgi:hypothetical protein
MDDQSLVRRLIEIGVPARRKDPKAYARPGDDPELDSVGAARIANWLEVLGGHQMVGDVQPCFTRSGAGFEFQATEKAVRVLSDTSRMEEWVNTVVPSAPEFDVFISYAAGDTGVAEELRNDLERNGLRCFMAEKDVQVATEWLDSIRRALIGSKRILVLLTPRSINRPWVLMETGAAWALGKPLIPAVSHVNAGELHDPMKRYQARVIETTAQRHALVEELTDKPKR